MDADDASRRCAKCPLADRTYVPGDGPSPADRVIVGEAPGETEAVEGKPFVGKAGRRLDEALAAAGADRSAIYVTNAVMCHPIGNQSPPPRGAISACHDRLIRELAKAMPRKILALGGTARTSVTGDSRPITTLRLLAMGSPFLEGDVRVRVTYHPSALQRDPDWPSRFDEDVRWLTDL